MYIIALFLNPKFRQACYSAFYKFDDSFEEMMGNGVSLLGFSDLKLFEILDLSKKYFKGEAPFDSKETCAKKLWNSMPESILKTLALK